MGSILREYKKYQRELVKKYGERSVVLLQVGSFYDISSAGLINKVFKISLYLFENWLKSIFNNKIYFIIKY